MTNKKFKGSALVNNAIKIIIYTLIVQTLIGKTTDFAKNITRQYIFGSEQIAKIVNGLTVKRDTSMKDFLRHVYVRPPPRPKPFPFLLPRS